MCPVFKMQCVDIVINEPAEHLVSHLVLIIMLSLFTFLNAGVRIACFWLVNLESNVVGPLHHIYFSVGLR